MRPNRAQAHSIIPTPAFCGDQALRSTFSLRYSLHHFYSLIQRQADGTLVLGVSRSNPTLSPETIAGRLSTDDTRYNEEIVQDALRSFAEMFPDYVPDTTMHGEGLDHAWTGIIAMTTDSVPFVGAIESLPGQYICAGFNGHGGSNFPPIVFNINKANQN
jgi:glycine/D-amino acid oxidase-like deaminating enzyme